MRTVMHRVKRFVYNKEYDELHNRFSVDVYVSPCVHACVRGREHMYPIHTSSTSSVSCTAPLHKKRNESVEKWAINIHQACAKEEYTHTHTHTHTHTQEDQSLNNRGCDDDTQ